MAEQFEKITQGPGGNGGFTKITQGPGGNGGFTKITQGPGGGGPRPQITVDPVEPSTTQPKVIIDPVEPDPKTTSNPDYFNTMNKFPDNYLGDLGAARGGEGNVTSPNRRSNRDITEKDYSNAKDGSDPYQYVLPESMSSYQAAKILETESPLLKKAQGLANQQTNSRGLMNSSMGTEAGTSAVVNVAADLGKQQAGIYGTAQQASQQGDIASTLSAQNYAQNLDVTAEQGDIASRLSTQDSDQKYNLANQAAHLTSLLNTQGFDHNRLLSEQGYYQAGGLSKQNYDQTRELQVLQQDLHEELTKLGYTTQERLALVSMVSAQTQTLMSQIGGLLNNPDIEMSSSVTDWMSAFMNSSWPSAGKLLCLNIDVS